jgi:hypothetical protein
MADLPREVRLHLEILSKEREKDPETIKVLAIAEYKKRAAPGTGPNMSLWELGEKLAKASSPQPWRAPVLETPKQEPKKKEPPSTTPKPPKILGFSQIHRAQIILFSKIVITSLEDAINYDPKRHHNRPPPDLRIDSEGYLQELRSLVTELKRLNALLESMKYKNEKRRAVIALSKHVNTFLDKYARVLGTGTAGLTVAALAGLLLQIGVGPEVVQQVLSHFKFK